MIHLTWPNESNDILLWYSATNWALCNGSLLSWGLGIQHKQQLSCSVPLGEGGLQFPRIIKNTSTSQICIYNIFIYIHMYIWENVSYIEEQKEGCTIYVIYANWGCGEKPTGGNYIDCEDQTEKNQSCIFAKQYWTEIPISLLFCSGSQKLKSPKLIK